LPARATAAIGARLGTADLLQALHVFFLFPGGELRGRRRGRRRDGVFFSVLLSCTTRGNVRAISSRARVARSSKSLSASCRSRRRTCSSAGDGVWGLRPGV